MNWLTSIAWHSSTTTIRTLLQALTNSYMEINRVSRSFALLFQVLVTTVVLFLVYMFYAVSDMDDFDMMAGIGLLFIQPLFALLLIALSIAMCLVVGLPIRLNKKVRQWWFSKPILPVLVAATGLVLLLFALHPGLKSTASTTIHGEPVVKTIPNTTAVLTGWLFTAFGLLHIYPQALFLWMRQKWMKRNAV